MQSYARPYPRHRRALRPDRSFTAQAQPAASCNFRIQRPVDSGERRARVYRQTSAKIADMTPAKRGTQMRLGYVVAARFYTSGAIVVKTRHRPAPGASASPGQISVSAGAYTSPCEGRAPHRASPGVTQTNTMSAAMGISIVISSATHAPCRRKSGCLSCRYRRPPVAGVRQHRRYGYSRDFMFARDPPAGSRRMCGRKSGVRKTSWWLRVRTPPPQTQSDFGAIQPTGRKSFPIARRRKTCIAFTVTHVPNTSVTEVMIVVQTMCCSPFRFADPQQTRSINWRTGWKNPHACDFGDR